MMRSIVDSPLPVKADLTEFEHLLSNGMVEISMKQKVSTAAPVQGVGYIEVKSSTFRSRQTFLSKLISSLHPPSGIRRLNAEASRQPSAAGRQYWEKWANILTSQMKFLLLS